MKYFLACDVNRKSKNGLSINPAKWTETRREGLYLTVCALASESVSQHIFIYLFIH